VSRLIGYLEQEAVLGFAVDDHGHQVAELAEAVSREMGLSEATARRCAIAGFLHDVGKAFLPEVVLEKEGPLSDEDWRLIREHPKWGAKLVSLIPDFAEISAIIRDHHERPDGGGYPEGKTGSEIRLEARIIAVCDAWAAMRSERPYRSALTADQAAGCHAESAAASRGRPRHRFSSQAVGQQE